MTRREKLLRKVLRGTADTTVGFDELRDLMIDLGVAERHRGSHHIFSRDGIQEIINLQPRTAGRAKPYQVRQVRQLILRHRLAGEEDGENG